jgi:tellurite resistance protein
MDIERTMEFIVEQLARSEANHAQWEEHVKQQGKQHDLEIATIRRNLSRAVKAGILEARNARKRHQEFDEKMTQLAAAQLVTEEKLQALIDSRRKDTNGHS